MLVDMVGVVDTVAVAVAHIHSVYFYFRSRLLHPV